MTWGLCDGPCFVFQVYAGNNLSRLLFRIFVRRLKTFEIGPALQSQQEQPPQRLCVACFSFGATQQQQQAAASPPSFSVIEVPDVSAAAAAAAAAVEAAKERGEDVEAASCFDPIPNPQQQLLDLLQEQLQKLGETATGGTVATPGEASGDVAAPSVPPARAAAAISAAAAKAAAYEKALVRLLAWQVLPSADSTDFLWSASGTALLVVASTTVDATGASPQLFF